MQPNVIVIKKIQLVIYLFNLGSEDHTLRVFRIEDGVGVYTLHGHCGPITSVFIDRHNHSGIVYSVYTLHGNWTYYICVY